MQVDLWSASVIQADTRRRYESHILFCKAWKNSIQSANVIKLSRKSFNDGYIGYTRNCVAFFLMLKMFLHHKKKLNIF